jgi:phosphohistidine phosphatase
MSVEACDAGFMAVAQPRKLVLLRHAKSAWPDVPDHERPLGRRGRRDAPAAGRWLRLAGCVPDHVVCSTARRARETWHLAEPELGSRPPVEFEPGVYGASAAGLLDLIRRLPPAARTVVVVGHDPGIPELALALAAGPTASSHRRAVPPPAPPQDRMRQKFPTAAVAVLELSGPWSRLTPGRARLAAFVTPPDMRETPGTQRRE